MTDFQNWWDGYFHEINGQKETAQAAWKTATLAERERCASIAETTNVFDPVYLANKIRGAR